MSPKTIKSRFCSSRSRPHLSVVLGAFTRFVMQPSFVVGKRTYVCVRPVSSRTTTFTRATSSSISVTYCSPVPTLCFHSGCKFSLYSSPFPSGTVFLVHMHTHSVRFPVIVLFKVNFISSFLSRRFSLFKHLYCCNYLHSYWIHLSDESKERLEFNS